MIVQRFLTWVEDAPADMRVEGARVLCRALLYSPLTSADRRAAEAAITLLVEDTHTPVRVAMAQILAEHPRSPRHVVMALARDAEEVATPVLLMSPILGERELVDLALLRQDRGQAAIAARNSLTAGVTAALVEIGTADTCTVLARNPKALFTSASFTRLAERFGDDADVRAALLDRDGVPLAIRHQLLVKLSAALGGMASRRFSLSEVRAESLSSEGGERATLALVADEEVDLAGLVLHLRSSGQLNAALLLRAMMCGQVAFFEEAVAELAEIDVERVRPLLGDRDGMGFTALYRRSGLPVSAMPAFRTALAGWEEWGAPPRSSAIKPDKGMVQRALARQEANAGPLDATVALLRQMEAEASRDEAFGALDAVRMPPRLVAA